MARAGSHPWHDLRGGIRGRPTRGNFPDRSDCKSGSRRPTGTDHVAGFGGKWKLAWLDRLSRPLVIGRNVYPG
jgi:hypothetical protein